MDPAAEIAGPPPIESLAEQRMLDRPTRYKRRIGGRQPDGVSLSDRLIEYFDRVNAIEDRLRDEGIDHVVFLHFLCHTTSFACHNK